MDLMDGKEGWMWEAVVDVSAREAWLNDQGPT